MTTTNTPDRTVPSRYEVIKGLRCGGCDHFTRVRAPIYSSPCAELGVTKEAAPCRAFSPMPTSVRMNRRHDPARMLAKFLINTPTSDLASLAALIAREHITRKKGFYFGQPVYIRIFGDGSFLNHYAKAVVVRADNASVYVQGADKQTKPFRGQLHHGSVITVEKFAVLRKRMQAAGKTIDRKAEAFFGGSNISVRDIGKVRRIHPKHGLAGTKNRPTLGTTTLVIGRKKVNVQTTEAPKKFEAVSLRD